MLLTHTRGLDICATVPAFYDNLNNESNGEDL